MNKDVADNQSLTLDEETKNRIQLLSFFVILFILAIGVIAVVVFAEQ